MTSRRIRFELNGESRVADVPAERLLLQFLRDDLGLTGTKEGCSVGVCGLCTIRVDGSPISACLTLAVSVDGAKVQTVEGLAQADGRLSPLQTAFIEQGGFQCGICTPGQLMTATALLEAQREPSDPQIKAWMLGNLCRCTGYGGIVRAIRAASRGQARAG